MSSAEQMGTGAEAQPSDHELARRRSRFRRFAYRVALILAPAHVYVAWSLVPDLTVDATIKALGYGVLVVSALLIPFGTMARLFIGNDGVVKRMVWAGSVTMGWFSSVVIFTLLRDLILLVAGRPDWAATSALVVLVASVLVTLVGFFNARRVAKVVRVTVPLATLPKSLDGFTIAQITDIHVGPTIKGNYVRGIVDRVNSLNADVVAITGDVVDGKVHELTGDTAPLGDLRARYGSYIVTATTSTIPVPTNGSTSSGAWAYSLCSTSMW